MGRRKRRKRNKIRKRARGRGRMRKEEEKKKMAHYSALTDGLPVSSKITSESTVKT
jgi:hypothetical protein